MADSVVVRVGDGVGQEGGEVTKLRDDGYMEIGAEPRDKGDPVVAACFLRQDVLMRRESGLQHESLLMEVAVAGVCGLNNDDIHPYPLLIPAQTAAEVTGYPLGEMKNPEFGVVASYVDAEELSLWLCHHTWETP